jgi:hypothetical protein
MDEKLPRCAGQEDAISMLPCSVLVSMVGCMPVRGDALQRLCCHSNPQKVWSSNTPALAYNTAASINHPNTTGQITRRKHDELLHPNGWACLSQLHVRSGWIILANALVAGVARGRCRPSQFLWWTWALQSKGPTAGMRHCCSASCIARCRANFLRPYDTASWLSR